VKKILSELVEDIAREQTERILSVLVDARVFVEVNQGQDDVRLEWEKAEDDV
jgi:hypothetical protein